MKNNNVCAVYSLVNLVNILLKDSFISLDIIECTFDDTYTIKLSWLNGVYSTENVFTGDEVLKDNGKLIADFIQQETGYNVHEDIEEIASYKKREKPKVEKVRDELSINDFISALGLNPDSSEILRCVARASYENDKLYYLKKARWYLNRLIDRALQEELQREEEAFESAYERAVTPIIIKETPNIVKENNVNIPKEKLAEAKKYCEEDVIATQDMFDYINNAFGVEIFSTKKKERRKTEDHDYNRRI